MTSATHAPLTPRDRHQYLTWAATGAGSVDELLRDAQRLEAFALHGSLPVPVRLPADLYVRGGSADGDGPDEDPGDPAVLCDTAGESASREPTADDVAAAIARIIADDRVECLDTLEGCRPGAIHGPDPAPPAATVDDRVYDLLAAAATDGRPCPSNAELADAIADVTSTVTAAIGRLRDAGKLQTELRGPKRRVAVVQDGTSEARWTLWTGGWVPPGEAPAEAPAVTPAPRQAGAVRPASSADGTPPPDDEPDACLLHVAVAAAARTGDWCPTDMELSRAITDSIGETQRLLRRLVDRGSIAVETSGRVRRMRAWTSSGWSPWTDWTGGAAPAPSAAACWTGGDAPAAA